jgi:hypothetical protein
LFLTWYLQRISDGIAPRPGQPPALIFPALGHLFERTPGAVTVFGFLPVVPMVLGSALAMVFGSLLTRPPSQSTIDKYFKPQEEGTSAGETVCAPEPVRT